MRRLLEYLLLTAGLCIAAAVVTWPHARFFTSHVVSQIDPLFSMWRLAWFAHAVRGGENLLNGNIFYPEPGTFLLSDATFLEGALGAPGLWAGVPLPVIYNGLLLLGIVSSGVALYAVARDFGIRRAAAALGALVFSLAPYRIAHVMHLELQWIAPGVLAFAALHRVLYRPHWRFGLWLGILIALQFLACVYYAIFLLPLMAVATLAALRTMPDIRRSALAGLVAAVCCAALALPVARLYVAGEARVGERSLAETARYSARWMDYLSAPAENTLYGWTAGGRNEERLLFPGVVAIAFSVIGLFSPRRRVVAGALLVTLVALELSRGTNGIVYPVLHAWWPVLRGLRAPGRFGVFVLAGVGMLAALGCERMLTKLRPGTLAKVSFVGVALCLVCLEYFSPQRELSRMDMDPPVYRMLRQLPDGVVLELPVAPPVDGEGVDLDPDYVFWSTRHWRKIVNGYSGYYPPAYRALLDDLRSLPDSKSVAILRDRGVRYILVHQTYLTPRQNARMVPALLADPEMVAIGSYRDWLGPTLLFEIAQ